MRKLNKRISIQLPEYMWKRLEELVPELPTTTRNGAILTLLEKGMNYYAKPKGKGAPVANGAPNQESAKKPVDQENNKPKKWTKQDEEELQKMFRELYPEQYDENGKQIKPK